MALRKLVPQRYTGVSSSTPGLHKGQLKLLGYKQLSKEVHGNAVWGRGDSRHLTGTLKGGERAYGPFSLAVAHSVQATVRREDRTAELQLGLTMKDVSWTYKTARINVRLEGVPLGMEGEVFPRTIAITADRAPKDKCWSASFHDDQTGLRATLSFQVGVSGKPRNVVLEIEDPGKPFEPWMMMSGQEPSISMKSLSLRPDAQRLYRAVQELGADLRAGKPRKEIEALALRCFGKRWKGEDAAEAISRLIGASRLGNVVDHVSRREGEGEIGAARLAEGLIAAAPSENFWRLVVHRLASEVSPEACIEEPTVSFSTVEASLDWRARQVFKAISREFKAVPLLSQDAPGSLMARARGKGAVLSAEETVRCLAELSDKPAWGAYLEQLARAELKDFGDGDVSMADALQRSASRFLSELRAALAGQQLDSAISAAVLQQRGQHNDVDRGAIYRTLTEASKDSRLNVPCVERFIKSGTPLSARELFEVIRANCGKDADVCAQVMHSVARDADAVGPGDGDLIAERKTPLDMLAAKFRVHLNIPACVKTARDELIELDKQANSKADELNRPLNPEELLALGYAHCPSLGPELRRLEAHVAMGLPPPAR